MAAPRPASSTSFSTRHLWMLVVALALALRSGIPMGYMLDPAAMQSGSLRLVLCSFGSLLPGPRQEPVAPVSHPMHHPGLPDPAGDGSSRHTAHGLASEVAPAHSSDHGDQAHDQACPFGLMMAQGLATPPVDEAVALTLPSLARTVPPGLAPETLPPLPPLGPPLGSRAPPRFLG